MSFLTAVSTPGEEIATRRIHPADFWLLGLRALVAVPLVYYQSWDQARRAWGFVWEQKPWDLAVAVDNLGLPQPGPVTVGLVFLLLAAPAGLLIGFVTRFNALVILVALGFVLVVGLDQSLSTTLNPQTLLLYLGMALLLAMAGGGVFSLDALMTRRRHKKKKKAR